MRFTKENTRKFGKRGGRPRGRLRQSKLSLREVAGMVVMDPRVQQRVLKQARAGTLPPRVLIELFHYCGGLPPSKPEPTPPDPTHAERRAQLARLSKEELQQYEKLLLRMMGQPATAGTGGPAEPGHEEDDRRPGHPAPLEVAAPADLATTGSPMPARATIAPDPARESQSAPVAVNDMWGTPLVAVKGNGHGAQPSRRVRDGHDPDDAGHRVECRRCRAAWRARP
jgi:hypothetical protein